MTIVCGIEEAGRGPVIGPLVMCGVTMEEKYVHKLQRIGVKDSKLLTPQKREWLFDQIIALVKEYKIEILRAWQVDEALNDPNINLNWLEANTSIKIIDDLKPEKVIIDSPSNNVKAYKAYVVERLSDKDIEVLVEHKADLNHTIVAAASILAKVTRDREIEKIKQKVGFDFGSGYPSDPRTKDFLEKNWDKYPEIFRKTWASYKKYVKMASQKGLGEY